MTPLARRQSSADGASVWALPVSRELVALWTVLPPESSDVSIATNDPSESISFKRRLIVPGYRIHLFVLQVAALEDVGRCRVSFRADKGSPAVETEVTPVLAEWRTPGVAAVIRAVAALLSDHDQAIDARPFARALSIMSGWRVPCRYSADDGGVSLAVFDFMPTRWGNISLITASAGEVKVKDVVAVPHDGDGCCLLWRGDAFDQAFLEIDGDFVELRLDPPRQARDMPLSAWCAGLEPGQLDGVLDAFSGLATVISESDLSPLARCLPDHREIALGASSVDVRGVYDLGGRLILSVAGGGDLAFDVDVPRGSDARVGFRLLDSAPPAGDLQPAFLYQADLGRPGANVTLVRLTVSDGVGSASCWLTVQDLNRPKSRRDLRARVAWELADEDLVAAFARRTVGADAFAVVEVPPSVVLCGEQTERRVPLVICHFDGDEIRLKATLLALRLTLGRDLVVRLVHRARLGSEAILRLRSLCLHFGISAELVMCRDQVPIGHALALRTGDRDHAAIIVMSSGVVPLDAGAWSKAVGRLARSPGLIYWQPPTLPPGPARGVDYLACGAPLIVVAPKTAPEVLLPGVDLFTFEGFARSVLSRATFGRHPADLPAMAFSVGGDRASSYGDVRLDDAVIDEMLAGRATRLVEDAFDAKVVSLDGAGTSHRRAQ